MFDNFTSWFFFSFFIINQGSITKYLDSCFIKKNYIFLLFSFVSFCSRNSSFFCNKSKKWCYYRNANLVIKLLKDLTNCMSGYVKFWVNVIKSFCNFKAYCTSIRTNKLIKMTLFFRFKIFDCPVNNCFKFLFLLTKMSITSIVFLVETL